ncbi:MAG: cytochrome c oxidase assembly protein, partial [Trebonia sp.]
MFPLAPLTALRAVTSWRVDVPALIVVIGLGVGYLVAVARLRRLGQRWAPWRAVSFVVLGLASVVLVTMSA